MWSVHEVRATVPTDRSATIAQMAVEAGIRSVSIYEICVYGSGHRKHVVSVETSTSKAKAFVDALLASPVIDLAECSITLRELRAIVSHESLADLTPPGVEPAPDVIEDLWQQSHLTPSYVGRAAGGALLLAQGVISNSAISIVVAALFLPFLAQVLAVGFGVWCGDGRLVRKGSAALLTSTLLAYGGGFLVATLMGGKIGFQDFKHPLPSFAISAVIGIAAGLSLADDAGRRYLIGVAAAVQFAIVPVWFGAASVLGLPSRWVLFSRAGSFFINVVAISVAAIAANALIGLKRQEIRRFIRLPHNRIFR